MFIVSVNTDNTSSNSNKAMVIVGASNREGKISNKAADWLVSNLVVDIAFNFILGWGYGGLTGLQQFIVWISRDKEYAHKIDCVNNIHRIETHVLIV